MTNRLTAAITCVLAASLFPAGAMAQQAATNADGGDKDDKGATNLDRMIVTGTRAPKSVDKIPGAITLVSKEEIKHTLLVTEDATAVLARTVPG